MKNKFKFLGHFTHFSDIFYSNNSLIIDSFKNTAQVTPFSVRIYTIN